MNRQYIDDHHLVARYLADQLPDTEREAFEAYYLEHPEIVQEMEAAARFKVGLAQLRESGELESLLKPTPWFRQKQYQALAAGLAVIAVGLFVFFGRGPASQPALVASATGLVDRLRDPLPVVATAPIMRMRSTAADAELRLSAADQVFALRVLPEVEATPPRYRITLSSIGTDESLRGVGEIGALVPDAEGFVPVYVNSTKLAPGRYQLTLSGDTGTSAANDSSTFLIRVIPHSDHR
ncbi:MAG TPA: hypothetical protein PKE27_08320 [Povalibacter sp.]|uniref:hypothetical protein n=1 Tax=Povalibacter sp. TaxID=1962978 RepID=UPI002CACFA9B|nr:hypothetical protein [Povalibacter sp.]HMN44562.1 hypothetical protein [Povalibacter sp.]